MESFVGSEPWNKQLYVMRYYLRMKWMRSNVSWGCRWKVSKNARLFIFVCIVHFVNLLIIPSMRPSWRSFVRSTNGSGYVILSSVMCLWAYVLDGQVNAELRSVTQKVCIFDLINDFKWFTTLKSIFAVNWPSHFMSGWTDVTLRFWGTFGQMQSALPLWKAVHVQQIFTVWLITFLKCFAVNDAVCSMGSDPRA